MFLFGYLKNYFPKTISRNPRSIKPTTRSYVTQQTTQKPTQKYQKMTIVNKQANPNMPNVDSILRKFYLKVHPDLFAGHPEEQKLNEKSFKSLTEYLESYKTDSHLADSVKLEFWTKKEGELKKISVQLSYPSPVASPESRQSMLKANLRKLFSQADITEEFDVTGYGGLIKRLRNAGANEISIIAFLIAAHNRIRTGGKLTPKQIEIQKRLKDLKESNTKLQNAIVSKFKLDRLGLEVPAVAYISPTARATQIKGYLETLQSALEELQQTNHKFDFLHGKAILFASNKNGPIGKDKKVIYLDISADRHTWLETLRSASAENSAALKEKLDRASNLEKDIAKALGVKKVESDAAIMIHQLDDYISYLSGLFLDITSNPGRWNSIHKQIGHLKIRFASKLSGVYDHEPATSSIVTTMTQTPEALAGLFTRDIEHIAQECLEINEALDSLSQGYKYSELSFDPTLPATSIIDFINRFSTAHSQLRDYMNGLNIRVTSDYSVNEDANLIFIKWDFLL